MVKNTYNKIIINIIILNKIYVFEFDIINIIYNSRIKVICNYMRVYIITYPRLNISCNSGENGRLSENQSGDSILCA